MCIVDAYCHVGLPRFSSAEDALAVFDLMGIERGVLVLGPKVPDFVTLAEALRLHSDRVRGIGIPFGTTADEVDEVVRYQLRAGVMGLRMEPEEILNYPHVLTLLGERGRWLYAIGAVSSPAVMRVLLAWLERYPTAGVAAPHFLAPEPLFRGDGWDDLRRDLVAHPRFYPIFSRHGGVRSQQPYPHDDLRAWVREVIACAGWDRLLWGSEYPVLYWRNETLERALRWLGDLLPGCAADAMEGFLGLNAARVLFREPAPLTEPTEAPDWVEARFDRDRQVPLFEGGFGVSMDLYARLHHRYVERLATDRELTFARFVEALLARQV